jgi:predicted negative regulator of RcsB-dependent stress response
MPGEDVKDVSLRHVHMGRRQLRIGQLDKALASARTALEQSPTGAGYALVGDIAAARGDCGAALKHYQKALELDPAEPYAQAGQRACAGK